MVTCQSSNWSQHLLGSSRYLQASGVYSPLGIIVGRVVGSCKTLWRPTETSHWNAKKLFSTKNTRVLELWTLFLQEQKRSTGLSAFQLLLWFQEDFVYHPCAIWKAFVSKNKMAMCTFSCTCTHTGDRRLQKCIHNFCKSLFGKHWQGYSKCSLKCTLSCYDINMVQGGQNFKSNYLENDYV